MKNKMNLISERLTMPIVLVGLMGAGKTSLGRILAQALDLGFIDSDDVITANAGLSIPQIFEQKGEEYFRELERDTLHNILTAQERHIIGTGGGAFMNDRTREIIKNKSVSVFLKADIDVLVDRVGEGSGRPLLAGKHPKETLEALMQSRYPIYEEAAITLETRHEDIQETLDRMMSALYNHLAVH